MLRRDNGAETLFHSHLSERLQSECVCVCVSRSSVTPFSSFGFCPSLNEAPSSSCPSCSPKSGIKIVPAPAEMGKRTKHRTSELLGKKRTPTVPLRAQCPLGSSPNVRFHRVAFSPLPPTAPLSSAACVERLPPTPLIRKLKKDRIVGPGRSSGRSCR